MKATDRPPIRPNYSRRVPAKRRLVQFPPQHGAWAFLIVPLVLGALLGAGTWLGLVFAVTWVAAYPVSYFGGRGLLMRIRRGSFTTKTKAEFRASVPWAIVAGLGAVTLIVARPWIVVPGIAVGVIWSISLWLTWIGRERGITNDLLLTVLASIATPFMWAIANDQPNLAAIPTGVWQAAVVSLLFFIGSVLHVKSLIRGARDARWHWASVAFHVLALVAASALTWWLTAPFAVALARTVAMPKGLTPKQIGLTEAAVTVLLVACAAIGLR